MVRVDNQGKETVDHFVTSLTTNRGETVTQTDGMEFHTTAHWDSGKLITSTVSTDKRFIPSVEVRSLSKDGKTMTVESYDRKIEGEPILTMIFERATTEKRTKLGKSATAFFRLAMSATYEPDKSI
jgi:hypothetical protein